MVPYRQDFSPIIICCGAVRRFICRLSPDCFFWHGRLSRMRVRWLVTASVRYTEMLREFAGFKADNMLFKADVSPKTVQLFLHCKSILLNHNSLNLFNSPDSTSELVNICCSLLIRLPSKTLLRCILLTIFFLPFTLRPNGISDSNY